LKYRRSILPNLLTLSNLFIGFYAILMISRGHYMTACWLIIVAGIVDGLDGCVARLIHSDSDFGREIDSLVDVVSFGVASSLLIYKIVFEPFGLIGILLAFMPLVTGVLRLARYNISQPVAPRLKGRRMFIGIPITAAAAIIVSFNIYIHAIHGGSANQLLWFSLIPAISLLMISPLPYRPMPGIRIHGSKHPRLAIAFLIAAALIVIWNPALTLFPLGLMYMFSGPVEWGLFQLRKVRVKESEDDISNRMALSNRREERRNRRGKK